MGADRDRQVAELTRQAQARAQIVAVAIDRIVRSVEEMDRHGVLGDADCVIVAFPKFELLAICEALSGR